MNNFESIDDMRRSVWRSWFITPLAELNNESPNIACNSPEGKAKIVSLLRRYEDPNCPESERIKAPPPAYARWKLGIDEVPDGATRFAEEEILFKGNDSPAALALLTRNEGSENSKNICNFCLQWMKNPLMCSRCRCRRYCSPECQKKEWKDHKRYCIPAPGSNAPKPTKGHDWVALKGTNICPISIGE